ncbi:MAG: hypothetical protein LLF96_07160 [Eubacteriales bacterium]|nr:hypothetical protein [Eubacteriales bacterium]
MTKYDLPDLLYDTIKDIGGKADIISICKSFWKQHQDDLIDSGDLYYTWQYDIRWAATGLRKSKRMKAAEQSPSGIWEII